MPIAPESRVLPSDTTEGKSINKVVVCMYKTANQANQVNISSTIVVQVLCSEGIMVSHGAWMVAAFPAGRASMGRPPRRDRRDATAINRPTWRLGPLRSVASVSGRRHSASYRQRCGTITHQNIGEMGHREWGSEKGNLRGENMHTGLYPAVGAGGRPSWCRSRSRSGRSKTTCRSSVRYYGTSTVRYKINVGKLQYHSDTIASEKTTLHWTARAGLHRRAAPLPRPGALSHCATLARRS